jgi:hypothetical protein
MTNITIKPADYPFTITTDEEGLKAYIKNVAASIHSDVSEWYELELIGKEVTLDEVIWEGELNQDLGGWWYSPKYFNDTITINDTTKKVCDLIETITGTFDATEDNTEAYYNALMAAL